MGTVIFIILVAMFLWFASGRNIYISYKYSKMTGIELNEDLTREQLMDILKQKLNFPGLKEIYYNEKGLITLVCKYATNCVYIENGRLYVTKEPLPGSKEKTIVNIENAEAIKAYVQKIFDPDAPVNPSEIYGKFDKYRKIYSFSRIIEFVITVAFIIFVVWLFYGKENLVKQSYLTEYSSSVTIGEAFETFFDNPDWSEYKEGDTKYVKFSGNCLLDEQDVRVNMIFEIDGDRFYLEETRINGTEVGFIIEDALLSAVYE